MSSEEFSSRLNVHEMFSEYCGNKLCGLVCGVIEVIHIPFVLCLVLHSITSNKKTHFN